MPRSSSPYFLLALALCAFLLPASPRASHAWGRAGHEIVARIAEAHLTPRARERVAIILGTTETLPSVASWGDEVRRAIPISGPWHYRDRNIHTGRFLAEKHPNGSSIDAVATDTQVLYSWAKRGALADEVTKSGATTTDVNANAANPSPRVALKFLVHLVGDLHQPLHNADDDDEGGNKKAVSLMGGPKDKLHAVWDSQILERMMRDEGGLSAPEMARRLDARALATSSPAELATGNPLDWSTEGYLIARDFVYAYPRGEAGPNGEQPVGTLDEAYYKRASEIVASRLAVAGHRLAGLLNLLLDTSLPPTGDATVPTTAAAPVAATPNSSE